MLLRTGVFTQVKRTTKLVTTFFYTGYSPLAPGTVGSLGGLVIYFLVRNNTSLYVFTTIFIFAMGILFSGQAEKIYGKKDAPAIVIDEVCGMLLSLLFVPFGVYSVVLGFFLFRLFDIFKPFPARSVERVPGSFGVMFDDVIAGLYTNIVLQIIFRFFVKS